MIQKSTSLKYEPLHSYAWTGAASTPNPNGSAMPGLSFCTGSAVHVFYRASRFLGNELVLFFGIVARIFVHTACFLRSKRSCSLGVICSARRRRRALINRLTARPPRPPARNSTFRDWYSTEHNNPQGLLYLIEDIKLQR